MRDGDISVELLIERGWTLEETTSPSSTSNTCHTFRLCHGGETIIRVHGCDLTRDAALDSVRSSANEWLKDGRIERENGANMALPSWRRWP